MSQLEQFLAHFPPEQLLVVDLDEVAADPAATMARVFAHAGVDPSFRSPVFNRRYNSSAVRDLRRAPAVSAAERLIGPERAAAAAPGVPSSVVERVARASRPAQLDADARRVLEAHLRPEVDRLRDHTGLAFAGWRI